MHETRLVQLKKLFIELRRRKLARNDEKPRAKILGGLTVVKPQKYRFAFREIIKVAQPKVNNCSEWRSSSPLPNRLQVLGEQRLAYNIGIANINSHN